MLLKDDCQRLAVGQLDLVLLLVLSLEFLQMVEGWDREGEVTEDTFLMLHTITFSKMKRPPADNRRWSVGLLTKERLLLLILWGND